MNVWKLVLSAICSIVFFAEADNGAVTLAEFSPQFDINFLLKSEEQNGLSEDKIEAQYNIILSNLYNKARKEALSDSEIKGLIYLLYKENISFKYSRRAVLTLLEASKQGVFSLNLLREIYSLVENDKKIKKKINFLHHTYIQSMFIDVLTKQIKYFNKESQVRFLLSDHTHRLLRNIISNKDEKLDIRISAMDMLKERFNISIIPYRYYMYLEQVVLDQSYLHPLRKRAAETLIEGVKKYKIVKNLHRRDVRFQDLVLDKSEEPSIQIAILKAMVEVEKNYLDTLETTKLKNNSPLETTSFTTFLGKLIKSKETDITLRRTAIVSLLDLVKKHPKLFVNDRKVNKVLKYIAYRNPSARTVARLDAKQILTSFNEYKSQKETSWVKRSINYVTNRCQKAF